MSLEAPCTVRIPKMLTAQRQIALSRVTPVRKKLFTSPDFLFHRKQRKRIERYAEKY